MHCGIHGSFNKPCSRYLKPGRQVLLFIILITVNVYAGGQIISLSAGFDTTTIMIGEQTNYYVTVEQPAGMHVQFPRLTDTLSSGIEILSENPADTIVLEDGRLKIDKSYRITSFDRGEHFAGNLTFVFMLDNEERVITARRARLEVRAPDVDQEAGIYDIKDPFGIPVGLMEVVFWLILLALAGLLVWGIIRYTKRRKHDIAVPEKPEPSEPANIIALRELKLLKSESLWQQGKLKEYYTRLTDIVRIYIERQFGIMAMELTSDEIIGRLYGINDISSKTAGRLGDCFGLADLVKFAKARPAEDEHETAFDTAVYFVNNTYNNTGTEYSENNSNTGLSEKNDPGPASDADSGNDDISTGVLTDKQKDDNE